MAVPRREGSETGRKSERFAERRAALEDVPGCWNIGSMEMKVVSWVRDA